MNENFMMTFYHHPLPNDFKTDLPFEISKFPGCKGNFAIVLTVIFFFFLRGLCNNDLEIGIEPRWPWQRLGPRFVMNLPHTVLTSSSWSITVAYIPLVVLFRFLLGFLLLLFFALKPGYCRPFTQLLAKEHKG